MERRAVFEASSILRLPWEEELHQMLHLKLEVCGGSRYSKSISCKGPKKWESRHGSWKSFNALSEP